MADIRGIVFDLDGTLADSASLVEGPRPRVPWHVLERVKEEQSKALRFQAAGFDLGIPQIVAEFIRSGLRVAVVTRSPEAYASTLMWHLGCDFHILRASQRADGGGEVGAYRRVERAIQDLRLGPREVLYVGDTPADRKIAERLGCQYVQPFWTVLSSGDTSHRAVAEDAAVQALVEFSETLRRLVIHSGVESRPKVGDSLDSVVSRFHRGVGSVADAEWLRKSKFDFWKAIFLNKRMPEVSSVPQVAVLRSTSTLDEDATYEFIDRAMADGDWARLALVSIEQIRWYVESFPESTMMAARRAMFHFGHDLERPSVAPAGHSIVSNSVFHAMGNAGVKAVPRHSRVPIMGAVVDLMLDHWREVNRVGTVQSVRTPSHLGLPSPQAGVTQRLNAPRKQGDVLRPLRPVFGIAQGDVRPVLRNDYDFDLWALKRLLESADFAPEATDLTSKYPNVIKAVPGSPRVQAFLPYRSIDGSIDGQDFWLPIKNWHTVSKGETAGGKQEASGPNVHLHYLETVALAMCAHLQKIDPAGRRPLIAMPASDATADHPACTSMRLARRVGQLLQRQVHYPLSKDNGLLAATRSCRQGEWNTAILIEDQVTTGRTYITACGLLKSAPLLLAWSSSARNVEWNSRDYQWA